MGYPKHYVGHYRGLAKWLVSQGHAVYPVEMFCEPVPVPDKERDYILHYLYGLVDVVSMFHRNLWAWEWKSQNDSVVRGIAQVKNYCRSFDYVSLVAVDLAKVDAVFMKKRERVSTILKQLGVGIFWCHDGKIEEVVAPLKQTPIKDYRDKLFNRFIRYALRKPIPSPSQTTLGKYAS